MSIDTAENTTVHLTAKEHLADLQARALNGEAVQASDLAEAFAAVQLSELRAEGQSRRERKAQQDAAKQAQADAKRTAAETVGRVNPTIALEAFDAAVDALEALYSAAEAYNATIQSIGEDFEQAGVHSRSSISSERASDPFASEVDPQNHAVPDVQGGGVFTAVKVDGTVYGRLRTSDWLGHALKRVAQQHNDLPVPYEASIGKRLGLNAPFDGVLAEHLSQ